MTDRPRKQLTKKRIEYTDVFKFPAMHAPPSFLALAQRLDKTKQVKSNWSDRGKVALALPPTLVLLPLLPLPMSLPALQFAHRVLPFLPFPPFDTHSTQERLHRNLLLLILRCARPFDRFEAPDTRWRITSLFLGSCGKRTPQADLRAS